ncbi:histidine phosphatase family protein [Emcibacter sp. SYSU 3D8]|uniref:histidine phosphatase family protein n=1 Tax=Emcibacter sp. SYSU 3D8 TaxID=3133969 RepID=UPI0031FE7658
MSKPVRLYLIRHGQATGGWDQDMDPGLSELGWEQASEAAARLEHLGALPVISSPMRRTQETARPFTTQWKNAARIEPRISEIPSPSEDLEARKEWLAGVMAGTWSDPAAQNAGGYDLKAWRQGVIEAIREVREDTVFTSHFIAINVVAGHLLSDDRIVAFRPDNCSITVVENDGGTLRLVELGHEAVTEVR